MKLLENIKNKVYPSKDYIFDSIKVKNKIISIIYNEVLVDTKSLNEYILYRLEKLNIRQLNDLENNLPSVNIIKIKDIDIINYLNNGFVVIIYKNIYAVELRSYLERGITTIQSELSLSGPKDSFSENFNTNLGLIRRRIKSDNLKCIGMDIGRYTKTKIGLLYIEGIVKKDLVLHIKKNLSKINIDGIIDSSYLKNSIYFLL